MPESWGTPSPGPSPNYPDFYDDIIVEEGQSVEDDEEDSRLVRSASVGKRAKPTLVSSAAPRGLEEGGPPNQRPGPTPVQNEPFRDGTGYIENSSSSSVPSVPSAPSIPKLLNNAVGVAVTQDAMLNAYSSASAAELPTAPSPSPQPSSAGRAFSRLSAIRRPPKLDMDAVAKAESRGSLTSLPDLIRRATRLAASLEKGRRPASSFDDMDYDGDDRAMSFDGEKHQSGFSDMLAAFPPPAHAATVPARPSWRDSVRQQIQSWPLPLGSSRAQNTSQDANAGTSNSNISEGAGRRGRRCCGLPLWGFIIVLVVVILLVAAAVVIPIEFFVIRRQRVDREAQAALQQCEASLNCANGGTNVIQQGSCSCICSNGFTGFDCSIPDSSGCTTIALTGETTINNVTVGSAIPRLLQQSERNFSIPLSTTDILAKFSAGSLSCAAMNALVTFDGESSREAAVPPGALGAAADGVVFTTVTVMVGQFTTVTLGPEGTTTSQRATATPAVGSADNNGDSGGFTTIIIAPTSGTVIFATTVILSRSSSTPTLTSTMMTTVSGTAVTTPNPASFVVTDEVRDFARVAVLYVLQEETLNDAKTGQATLQQFFNSATPARGGVSVERARNVTLGNGNSIDLVDFAIDTKSSPRVGSKPAVRARGPAAFPFPHLLRLR